MSDDSSDDVKAISTLMSVLRPLDPDARVHVLDFVLKRLGITLYSTHGAGVVQSGQIADTAEPGIAARAELSVPHVPRTDIRSFADDKRPKTVNEKVAIIAYYISHLAPESERRDYIVSEDIKTYFIQAGFQLPTAPSSMTLVHAKNAGYLSAHERGSYKLNAVGYNLVAHKLPGGDSGERTRQVTKKQKARPKAKK